MQIKQSTYEAQAIKALINWELLNIPYMVGEWRVHADKTRLVIRSQGTTGTDRTCCVPPIFHSWLAISFVVLIFAFLFFNFFFVFLAFATLYKAINALVVRQRCNAVITVWWTRRSGCAVSRVTQQFINSKQNKHTHTSAQNWQMEIVYA